MDEETPKPSRPLSPAKMSKTPSWVMLGFVLGGLATMAITERNSSSDPEPAAVAEPVAPVTPKPVPAEPRPAPALTRIEAVFDEWGKLATWSDDTTEVALWDPATEQYTDFYEVRRVDGVLYFRSIPRLTRRTIARGKHLPASPLLFTETEEQFQAWDERDRQQRPLERMWQPPAKAVTPTPDFAPPVAPQSQPVAPKFEPPKPAVGGESK